MKQALDKHQITRYTTTFVEVMETYKTLLENEKQISAETQLEKLIKSKLIERGFSRKTLLNNRGLIGAVIEDALEQLIPIEELKNAYVQGYRKRTITTELKYDSIDEQRALREFANWHLNLYKTCSETLKPNEPQPNGIACPQCNKELFDSKPMELLTSMPPQKNVHCSGCNYIGYRTV